MYRSRFLVAVQLSVMDLAFLAHPTCRNAMARMEIQSSVAVSPLPTRNPFRPKVSPDLPNNIGIRTLDEAG